MEIEHDLGPATKVLPACKRWQNEDVDLLLCNDDRAEDPEWMERFARVRHERPDDIVCEAGWFVDSVSPHHRTDIDSPRASQSRSGS